MGRGIGKDLKILVTEAHEQGTCVTPTSDTQAHRLRYAWRHGYLCRAAPQVYALPELWNTLKPIERERRKLQALAKLHPNWVFAGTSAAVLHGLQVSNRLLGSTYLAVSQKAHSSSSMQTKRIVMTNDERTTADNTPVTSLSRTLFDCLRGCAFCYSLAIADSALRLYGLSSEELAAHLQAYDRHYHGWRHALDIAPWADGRSENGGESIVRAVIIELGFRLPELQHVIPNPVDRSHEYRVDYYWDLPTGPVAGELDGKEKYCNPEMTQGRDAIEVLTSERLRESRLSGTGTKIMRFSYNQALDRSKFSHLLTSFGIPSGYGIPPVALHDAQKVYL